MCANTKGETIMKLISMTEQSKSEILKYIPREEITTKLATYFQNFSDNTRLRILMCLSLCDMCVSDMANILNLNQTTISHQLQILRAQNMVDFRRDGKMILYSIKQAQINQVMLGAIEAIC